MSDAQHNRSSNEVSPRGKTTKLNDQSRSDLRRIKLRLLSEANELCQRAFIVAQNERNKQYQWDRMQLFEGAMDHLMSLGTSIASYNSDLEPRALRFAYDVVSADIELRDMAFYDVSYGKRDVEMLVTHKYY